jgi:hypothetical protein
MAQASAIDFTMLKQLDTFIGHLPDVTIVLTGFGIGAATSWLGWQAGKRPTVPIGAAAVLA